MPVKNVLATTSDVPGFQAGLVDRSDKDKDILILRGLEAGPGIEINVIDFDNDTFTTKQKKVVITATGGTGGPVGEANTASNLGAGIGLFARKQDADLQFRSLVAGQGISLYETAGEVTIEAVGVTNGVNLGDGTGVFASRSGSNLQFKSLVAGNNINIVEGPAGIQIEATAGNNTGINLGTGGAGTAGLYAGMAGADLTFRRLRAGAGVSLAEGTDEITITATGGGSDSTGGENLGTGVGVFAQKSGSNLQFKTLVAGSNVTLTPTATGITIDTTGDLTAAINRGTAAAGKAEVYASKTDDTLEFRRLVAGANVTLTQTADEITIAAQDTGEVNTGSNLGTGGEGVYAGKTGTNLEFKRIKGAGSVSVTADATSITITGTDDAGIHNLVEDTTPELGGDLDVRDYHIVSTAGRDIVLAPSNLGHIVLDGQQWPTVDGTAGQVLTTDGAGVLSWATSAAANTTASNVGTGVGFYKQKTGSNLEYRTLTVRTGKLIVSLDAANNEVDLDVVESALDLANLGGVLGVDQGGTGATAPAAARSNLGLGTMAVQDHTLVNVDGGSIDGTDIGQTAAAKGKFTDLAATGAVSLNGQAWPASDGTTGQVLGTDGAGHLSWITPTGGSGGEGGEANDGTNVGVTGVGVYKGKVGVSLQFKRLNAASTKIAITDDTANDKIDLDINEANLTLGNIGGSLPVGKGGTGRTAFTNNAVLIGSASGIAQAAAPSTADTYLRWTGTAFEWATVPGSTGEVNTAANVGTAGVGLYKQKTGANLEFRSINAGSGKITVTLDAANNEVDIDVAESALTLGNLGGTLPVGKGGTGLTAVTTNGLLVGGASTWTTVAAPAAADRYLHWTGTAFEWAAAPVSTGEANTASNLGSTGVGVFHDKSGVDLRFRRVNAASTKLSVTLSTDRIDLDVAEANLSLNNLGGTLGVAKGGTGLTAITQHAILVGGASGFTTVPVPPASDRFLHWTGTSFDWVSSTGGETNTASNVGTAGVGLFKQKTGANLEFRSINAGSGKITVALDSANNEVDIDVAESALTLGNLGGTLPVSKGGTGLTAVAQNTILVGGSSGLTAITAPSTADRYLRWTGTAFEWAAVSGSGGEANTASNVGTAGVGLFKQKTGANLEFRNVNAGSGKVTVTLDSASNEVDIDVVESALTLSNLGGTLGVAKGGTGATTLTAGGVLIGNGASAVTATAAPASANTYLRWTGSAFEWAAVSGAGEANTASNSGAAGVGVFARKTGVDLEFKNVAAGSTKVTVTDGGVADEVRIDINEANLTLGNLGGTLGVAKGGTGATTLTANALLLGNGTAAVSSLAVPASSNTYLRWSGSAYEWVAGTGGGEVNTASNVGTGGVGVFHQKAGVNLEFRNINAGSNKVAVTYDNVNYEIKVDVSEANLTLGNLGGTLGVAKGGTGATTLTSNGILLGNGTGAVTTIAAPSTADRYLRWTGTAFEWAAVTGGAGGAPVDAGYLVIGSNNGTLTNERVLSGSTSITVTDGGANGSVTLAAVDNTTTQKVEVAANGTTVANARKKINFVAGSNVTVTAADDAANDRVNVTISAASGGPSGGGGLSGPYEVRFTVNGAGQISSIDQTPSGWTVAGTGTVNLTVSSHNVGLEPRTVVFRGAQSASVFRVIPMIASGTHYIELAAGTESSAFIIRGLGLTNTGAAANQQVRAYIYF